MTLKPQKLTCQLAGNPTEQPKFNRSIINRTGDQVVIADPDATRAIVALMNQSAVNGGAAAHWGGPSAFAEINAAVHALMFQASSWHQEFNYVNDAGHAENGVYALRANYGFDKMSLETVCGFRSIESKFTGHGEAHLNPQGVFISNGPLGSGIGQAQGLSIADKCSGNKRTTICVMSDGASMEGEAKESFAAIPGLAAKGKLNPFLLIISDNNTKLSGRIDEESFSMAPTFNAMDSLGWNVIRVEKGHDLQVVYQAVEEGLEYSQKSPVCIVVKTIKGKGIKSTEEHSAGGHGYPLKAFDGKIVGFVEEIYGGNPPQEFLDLAVKLSNKPEAKVKKDGPQTEKVQAGIGRGMIKAAKEGLPVYSLSCDVPGSTGTKSFQSDYPEYSQDLGIAESNMVSCAVGLSKQGYIPVVDSFAQFGITKGALPLIMASLSQGPIIGVYTHTGFQDAADGASHQATTYVSAICSIPHVRLIHVATSKEAEDKMYQAIKYISTEREKGRTPESVIFFLGRENFVLDHGSKNEWGKVQVLKEGKDVMIAASGPMVIKALDAAKKLEDDGISATVINNSEVNHIDMETYKKWLPQSGNKLVTIEDHQLIGGMGALLAHELLQNAMEFKLKSLGIPGRFGQSAYTADQLYDKYGLNSDGIVRAVKEL